VSVWDRLADECKRKLIEMARANLPTQAVVHARIRRTGRVRAALVADWPELPEAIRAGIMATVRTASGSGK
jgi:hypothetical protein